MSSDDDLTQAILDAYARLFVENYCIIASSVILFADTIWTLPDEVQRIWRRKFTGAALIFLINRYVAVAERIVLLVSVVLPTVQDKSCVPVLRIDDALTDISYLTFGLFMMLRARGVSGQWTPLVFLGLLTPIRPIVYLYYQTHYTPLAFGAPLYGCGANIHVSFELYTKLGVLSRAASICLDASVLLITWYKTYGIKKESRRLGLNAPYVTLLLRDGTFYFLIILVVQVLGIISTIVGTDFVLWDVWPYFDQVFTVIFLSHFMLDLRGVYLSSTRAGDSNSISNPVSVPEASMISDMRFSSTVIGNMGAPLHSFDLATLGANTDQAEWTMEDETLETSSDPLHAGLGNGHVEGLELLQASDQV